MQFQAVLHRILCRLTEDLAARELVVLVALWPGVEMCTSGHGLRMSRGVGRLAAIGVGAVGRVERLGPLSHRRVLVACSVQ